MITVPPDIHVKGDILPEVIVHNLVDVPYISQNEYSPPYLEREGIPSEKDFVQWYLSRQTRDIEVATIELYNRLKPSDDVTSRWTQLTIIEPDIILGGIPSPDHDVGSTSVVPTSQSTPHEIVSIFGVRNLVSISDYYVAWDMSYLPSYRHYIVLDHPQTELFRYFDEISESINAARLRGDTTFIHCQAGISRSSTCLAAYYVRYGLNGNPHPTVEEVVRYIQNLRPVVYPNYGFLVQLVGYYEFLRTR
jgi:protein-tyrosine phosphatase